jgi:hypothetical protein
MWHVENIGLNMPLATPFYIAWVDLGPQPWFGCASRSWRENGGSDPFSPPRTFLVLNFKISLFKSFMNF